VSTILPPKLTHKHDKLFSSSDSSESDSETTTALLPGNPHKHSNADIPLAVSSHNTIDDDSFSDHSDVEGGNPLLPNMVNNDGGDIISFAYDETLLVENNKVRTRVCIISLVGFAVL